MGWGKVGLKDIAEGEPCKVDLASPEELAGGEILKLMLNGYVKFVTTAN